MDINKSIQYLAGVGPKMAEKLERLGIKEVRDLLFYYPRRYDDFSNPRKISSLRIGDDAIVKAEILTIKKSYTKRKWMTLIEAELADDSGKIKAVWFNQPFLLKILKPGDEWLFSGKVNWDFKAKTKSLFVSQYENPSADGPIILPVYNETEGLTSKYLRKIISPLLNQRTSTSKVAVETVGDYLPNDIFKKEKLIGLDEAIRKIHHPKNLDDIKIARERLSFDELFLIALRISLARKEQSYLKSISLKVELEILKNFVAKLPFKLTNAQRKTAWEIICDLKKEKPMNRLLEGDVGSGKTVVAAMAALVAIKAGYQAVWLAPTEILANQHYQNVAKVLKPFKVKIGLFTSANKLANLQNDNLIIGTHALIQKDIHLKNLALIIVDEQHRFGVKQRSYLRKGTVPTGTVPELVPHFLSMTATPIPRTLALALYGDLDISVISEMPKGRQKILTKIVSPQKRNEAYKFIEKQVRSGRQVFVVCPLIEEKGDSPLSGDCPRLFDIDRKSVKKEYEKLSKEIFPELRIGLMHGKMKSKEKEEVMQKFKKGQIDILVSTAVIEVGIDISNAAIMMIENAERFGLAQLHQFRGRVGRGDHQSYCFLFPSILSDKVRERLNAMTTCNNGFELAEIDLKLRGPGELAGIRQSGLPDLKMATLTDTILIEKSRKLADKIVSEGIENYPKLQEKLKEFEVERHPE